MNEMSLVRIAAAVEGELLDGDAVFTAVSTDSRELPAGALFVALRGERFDGHAFVAEAARQGAAAALLEVASDAALPQLRVADSRVALGRLAAWRRAQFDGPLVAVTGSNGKTTVKEMLAAILGRRGPLLATRGNLNNDIGVPLTLMRLADEQQAAVIEMGANHPGEIAYLAAIADPTVGVVTNAGRAHLEGFGGIEGVARAKGELFAGLGPDGVAVINADDLYAPLWRGLAGERRVLSFGLEADAAVSAREWLTAVEGEQLVSRFLLVTPAGEVPVLLALPGRHNVMNALAAAAAGLAAGATLEEIAAGLAAVQAPAGRLTPRRGPDGCRLLDDSYNANPGSLRAGLEVLTALPGRHWLVLGDMAELGGNAARLHAEMGELARELGVERLYAVGEVAGAAAEGFGAGAQAFAEQGEAIAALRAALAEAGGAELTLLVKGSRLARMERVIQGLTEG